MERAKLDRISALARKSRETSLTDEEKAEQQLLRREYIESYKQGLRLALEDLADKQER